MKIALCLSGELRSWKYCYHTIETALPNCEIDIFSVVWDREDIKEIKNLQNICKKVEIVSEEDERITKLKYFEEEILENFFKFPNNKINHMKFLPIFMFPRRELMSKISYDNIETKDYYDYIIRSRYDLRYCSNLKDLLEKDKLVLSEDLGGSAPEDKIGPYRAVYDGFAAGSTDVMETYYKITDWLPLYFEDEFCKNITFKAEWTMGIYLNKIKNVPIKYVRNILAQQFTDKIYRSRYINRNLSSNINQKENQSKRIQQYLNLFKKYHPKIFETYEIEKRKTL